MREPLVEISGCEVYQGRARLLGPVDLAVRPGEFWGVVGPNGAGKSTLLRLIAGLVRPARGEARWPGLGGGARGPRRGAVGFVLQHHDYRPDMPFCVEDVIGFGRIGLARGARSADGESVETALRAMALAPMRRRLYRELSGGEQRKVQLARLIAQAPPLLLLDEPAAGLDMDWQERLTRLVGETHRRGGHTTIMVTHDIDRLPACCTHALLLRQGRIVARGAPGEVFRADALGDVYGCRIEVVPRAGRYHAISLGDAAE